MDFYRCVIQLHEAAVELLEKLRGSHLHLLAWPVITEELLGLAEVLCDKLALAEQLEADGDEDPAVFEFEQALALLPRMIELASRAGMPTELIEDMEVLGYSIKRRLPGFWSVC